MNRVHGKCVSVHLVNANAKVKVFCLNNLVYLIGVLISQISAIISVSDGLISLIDGIINLINGIISLISLSGGIFSKGTQQKDQQWISLSNCILPGLRP